MKTFNIIVTLALFFLYGCKKNEVIESNIQSNTKTEMPFNGNWERQFEAGPGNLHTANYFIFQDSIRYTLSGSVGNANYVISRDTFLLENNRFIGHTLVNKYYLLFINSTSNDSISIYKQEVSTITEGLSITIPSDTTTRNHGWNTFKKK
jgi:hypothetical protein